MSSNPIARSVLLALVAVLAFGSADASAADPPTRFSVAVTGQGPDVVLIPGLATPGDVWEATAVRLSPTHRVHVVQVAGFGVVDPGSNKGDADMLPPVVAEMIVPAMGTGTAPIVAPDQIIFVLGDFRGDVWIRDV